MLRIFAYFVAACVLLGSVFAGGVWAGYELKAALQQRTSLPFRIQFKLVGYYNSFFRNDAPSSRTIVTNRVVLNEETVYLPVRAADYAGGITAIDGTSVLIFDRLGQFFLVDGATAVQLEGIAPPENNMAALQTQVEEGRFAPGRVDFKWFRYNDILHVRDGAEHYLLASYTEWQPEAFCVNSALARLDLPAGSAPDSWTAATSDWTVVKRTEPCLPPFPAGEVIKGLEAGGRLVYEGNGQVLWSSGSYERDDRHEGTDYSTALSQSDGNDYGKVLRVNTTTGATEIVARGLRNPQGLDRNRAGEMWVTDHGMRGGDEVNQIFAGANFGWPAVTYGTEYDTRPAGNRDFHTGHEGYDHPVFVFPPSFAPGAVAAVEDFHYAWDGDIVVGGFDGTMYRIHSVDGRAAVAEPVRLDVRSRDMEMLADGRIAIWTDDRRMVFLSAVQSENPVDAVMDRIAAAQPEALRETVTEHLGACLQCHGLAEGDHRAGPSLYGICGMAPGSTDFDGYSGALAAMGGVWTPDSLAAFIANPQQVASGTNMAWNGLENGEEALLLAQALCPQSPS